MICGEGGRNAQKGAVMPPSLCYKCSALVFTWLFEAHCKNDTIFRIMTEHHFL